VFEAVQDESALHTLLVDSTSVRAYQHAAEARKKTDRKLWAAAGAD
jgi:hypothetical protein